MLVSVGAAMAGVKPQTKPQAVKKPRAHIPNPKGGTPPPSKGRPLGVPNKITKAFKEHVVGAIEELGGQKWLVRVAKRRPELLIQLGAKLMPSNTIVDINFIDSLAERMAAARKKNGGGK
jgi:hypothetical protein